MNFKELKDVEPGTILHDEIKDGIRFIVMRGPSALCAYVGVPSDHPLAGFDYEGVPVNCHGGLTFSREGGDEWPEGWYWYGWDYAHAGDAVLFDRQYGLGDDVEWAVDDVIKDSWGAIYDFRELARLAEKIAAKTPTSSA